MNVPTSLRRSATCLGILQPRSSFAALTDDDIQAALANPIGNDGLQTIATHGGSLCIVVSDHTRKTAADRVLPFLLNRLTEAVEDANIFFLIASGIHRHPSDDEIRHILGAQIAGRFCNQIFTHDPDNDAMLTHVGTTKRGHDVRINSRAVQADHLILLGAATYHYHAGFGGGRKSLVPGLAARKTIAHNHGLALDPQEDRIVPSVEIGALDGNPVAEEMLESAYMCKPDLAINTVLSPTGDLVGIFCGELDSAHREACKLVEQVSRCNINRCADIVLASAGAASNWIQSHKALYNAHRAVAEHGYVILEAPCPEGIGNERFRYWVRKPTIAEIYAELRHSAEILGQTALSTRMRGEHTTLVTGLSEADISDLGIRTQPDVDSAAKQVLGLLAAAGVANPTYYTMPEARYVVPFVTG